ncbi:MAG: peptide deformylase [Alphaproteobacteria bacterium]|nr:peptide deformylase [Alphaproteobacteria bacterium]
MTNLPILIMTDPALREIAREVVTVDARIVKLMNDLLETMYKDNGIGLAANQVGVLERVIVIDISENRTGSEALFMANPTITWSSEETFKYKEGCLSIPGQYADVVRPKRIRMNYLDQNGKLQNLEAENLLSQCIQHEIDHLNGVLFIDHISKLKRGMITRKMEKIQRNLL